MSAPKAVLILAADPIAAALLGMLAELARYSPVFPDAGERAEDALSRLRPLLVVLLDGSLDAAQSDLFFRLATKRRVGLAIFGAPGRSDEAARHASRHQLPYADVPRSLGQFVALVDAALAGRQRRLGRRRQHANGPAAPVTQTGGRTERARDGTLIYHDETGQRWRVYDRRGGDRRASPASDHLTMAGVTGGKSSGRDRALEESGEPGAREFVAENGDTWTYMLGAREVHALSATELGRQLAHAIRGEEHY